MAKLKDWNLIRDIALFFSGLYLTFNESLFHKGEPRTDLLVLFGAMMGLPFVLRADSKKKASKEEGDEWRSL